MNESQTIVNVRRRRGDQWIARDITLDQWINTLQYFNGMCAYCQIRAYEVPEHFIPLRIGGGSTSDNLVPACISCNRYKSGDHPALVRSIPKEDIERVRDFLEHREIHLKNA